MVHDCAWQLRSSKANSVIAKSRPLAAKLYQRRLIRKVTDMLFAESRGALARSRVLDQDAMIVILRMGRALPVSMLVCVMTEKSIS